VPERPRLAADSSPEHRVIERLLEMFAIDGGLSRRVVQLMPTNSPLLNDPVFVKDRTDLLGAAVVLTPEAMAAGRPEAINEVRNAVDFLETTLLADGREWILQTEAPSLADIEALWPLYWIASVPGALPPDQISAAQYPKVFSWLERFQAAVSSAEKALHMPKTVSGEQAMEMIVASLYNETEGRVDENDPVVQHQSLVKGQLIQVWPTDSGSGHKDLGKLVSINSKEVTIETTAGNTAVRVHAPRHGFRIGAYNEVEQ
jgi:glutathione S-transferase